MKRRKRYFFEVLILLGACFGLAGFSQTSSATVLEVLNPLGAVEVDKVASVRVSDLSGKTICMLSNGYFRANEILPVVQELLQQRFPATKFIPYTELPVGYPNVAKIGKIVKAKGCDAVVLATGG